MTKKQAIAFFGSQVALADALGIDRSAVTLWKNGVPPGRQAELEIITEGQLLSEKTKNRRKQAKSLNAA